MTSQRTLRGRAQSWRPRALRSLGYQEEQLEAIVEYIAEHSQVIDAPRLKEQHNEVFDCAMGKRAISPDGAGADGTDVETSSPAFPGAGLDRTRLPARILSRLSRQEVRVNGRWQLQEAKQRFSEVVRSAASEGPQFVTRHGDEVAVVLDIREYRRLRGGTQDFKAFLRSAPDLDELQLDRSRVPAPTVELE